MLNDKYHYIHNIQISWWGITKASCWINEENSTLGAFSKYYVFTYGVVVNIFCCRGGRVLGSYCRGKLSKCSYLCIGCSCCAGAGPRGATVVVNSRFSVRQAAP